MASQAKIRANNKYNKANYENIAFHAPIGMRDDWKDCAAKRGISLAAFIQLAVNTYLVEHPLENYPAEISAKMEKSSD